MAAQTGSFDFKALKALDSSLDKESVFNRLTNNGTEQGLYMEDGHLYVNASYIKSGTLVLGGADNENGRLEIRDADDNVIGEWDKDGVTIQDGVIKMYNPTLDAALVIKDGNLSFSDGSTGTGTPFGWIRGVGNEVGEADLAYGMEIDNNDVFTAMINSVLFPGVNGFIDMTANSTGVDITMKDNLEILGDLKVGGSPTLTNKAAWRSALDLGAVSFSGTKNSSVANGLCNGIYDKAAGTVRLTLYWANPNANIGTGTTLFTIPAAYRPSASKTGIGIVRTSDNIPLPSTYALTSGGVITQSGSSVGRGGIAYIEYVL